MTPFQEDQKRIFDLRAEMECLKKQRLGQGLLNVEQRRMIEGLEKEVALLQGTLTDTLGRLHVIDFNVGLISSYYADPKFDVQKEAERIQAKRSEAHLAIVKALNAKSGGK